MFLKRALPWRGICDWPLNLRCGPLDAYEIADCLESLLVTAFLEFDILETAGFLLSRYLDVFGISLWKPEEHLLEVVEEFKLWMDDDILAERVNVNCCDFGEYIRWRGSAFGIRLKWSSSGHLVILHWATRRLVLVSLYDTGFFKSLGAPFSFEWFRAALSVDLFPIASALLVTLAFFSAIYAFGYLLAEDV